jgi:hypothetical protein
MLKICSSILERQPEHVNAGSGQNLLGRISKVTREAEGQIQVQVRPMLTFLTKKSRLLLNKVRPAYTKIMRKIYSFHLYAKLSFLSKAGANC